MGGAGDFDNSSFKIVNNELYTQALINEAGVKQIRVQVSDGVNTFEEAILITITMDDADNDGIADRVDLSPFDSSINISRPDLSDFIDETIGMDSNLGSLEEDLLLWMDASNMNAFNNSGLTDGDAVGIWMDLSGNGHHATQTNASYQPTFRTEAFNGQPTVSFDNQGTGGTDTSSYNLLNAGDVDLGSGETTDQVAIITVISQKSKSTYSTILHKQYQTNTNASNSSFYLGYSENDTSFRTILGNNTTNHEVEGGVNNIESPYIVSAMKRSAEINIYLNGLEVGSKISSTSFIRQSDESLIIGARGDGRYSHDGNISEIIIFNKQLSDEDLMVINYYLAKKWGWKVWLIVMAIL